MRIALVLTLCLLACNRDDGALRRADGSVLSTSAGEIALSDGSTMQVAITSERYKQWDAARAALDKRVVARFGELLQPRKPTERSIGKAVSYLQEEPQARQAIERTGMGVRDFVLLTVALEQEMQLAKNSGAGVRPDPIPQPLPLSPIDTGYRPNPVPSPDTVYGTPPMVRDTVYVPRADTARTRRDTLPRNPDPVLPVRGDTATTKRDTVVPRRDTVSAKAPPAVPPRDTVRDTLTKAPPDTSRRT